MKNLIKSVIIVLALIFVSVNTANADPACIPPGPNGGCFNGQVNIRLVLTNVANLTIAFEGAGLQPVPLQQVTGQASVTSAADPVGSGGIDIVSGQPVLTLQLGAIGGQAGPGDGAVFVFSAGHSSTMVLTNMGDQPQQPRFEASGMPHFHTRIAGFGTASMSYVFSVVAVDANGNVTGRFGDIAVQSVQGNGDLEATASVSSGFTVPAGSTVRIRIEGEIRGNAAVPEPTTMLLLGTGLVGVAVKVRKRLKTGKNVQGRQ